MLVNEECLIATAAKFGDLTISNTQNVHKILSDTIFNLISSVTPEYTKDKPLVIKVFKGISLKAYYEPEKTKKPNYSDNEIVIPPHIKIKADVSKTYLNKVNQ